MHKKIYILVLILVGLFSTCRVYAYESYKAGDKVTYNGEDYYVIEDSEADKNYVTLLKGKPLTAEEVNKYNSGEYESKNGEMPYYLGCDSISARDCINDYDDSSVKILVDNWSSNLKGLIEIDGYKARLITLNELLNQFNYETYNTISAGEDILLFYPSDITPIWVYKNNYSYWTMESSDYVTGSVLEVTNDIISFNGSHQGSRVRPVINLDKCSIENCLKCENGYKYGTEKVKRYNGFKIGDEITYKGEKYYVIKNSTSSSKTLTLLKAEPLTSDEINKNKGDLDFTSENNTMPYYKSEDCYYNSENDHNATGCTVGYSYNQSYVKQVIDKWSESFDDLIEVGGYKARLLNEDDLYRLGYNKHPVLTSHRFCKTEDTPEWVFDNIYWTMFSGEDGSSIYKVTENCLVWTDNIENYMNELSSVRPVINIDKCAVDGGCYEEEIKVATGCKDTNTSNNVVNVPNTLKKVSITIFVICGILLVSGIGIIIFNCIKSRKERKRKS